MWVDPDDDPRETDVEPVDERSTLVEFLRGYRLTLEDRDGDWNGALPDRSAVDEAWRAWRAEVRFADHFVSQAPDLEVKALRVGAEGTSLRWVLIHLIEEYARHCGHADLLRERIDGRVGQ
jgi:hypothetical protein